MEIKLDAISKKAEEMRSKLSSAGIESSAEVQDLSQKLDELTRALAESEQGMTKLSEGTGKIPAQLKDLVASFGDFESAGKLVQDLVETVKEFGPGSKEAAEAASNLKIDIEDLIEVTTNAKNAIQKNISVLDAETAALKRNTEAHKTNKQARAKKAPKGGKEKQPKGRDVFQSKESERGEVIVFDTETTGLDTSSDQPHQIAAVRMTKDGKITDTFDRHLKTSRIPHEEVTRKFGHTKASLDAKGDDPREVYEAFTKFTEGATTVAGHNIKKFDMPLLNKQLKDYGLESPFKDKQVADTLEMSKQVFPPGGDVKPVDDAMRPSYNLASLANFMGVELTNAHEGLSDTIASAQILALLFKKLATVAERMSADAAKAADTDEAAGEVFGGGSSWTDGKGVKRELDTTGDPGKVAGFVSQEDKKILASRGVRVDASPYGDEIKQTTDALNSFRQRTGPLLDSEEMSGHTDDLFAIVDAVTVLQTELWNLRGKPIDLLDDEEQQKFTKFLHGAEKLGNLQIDKKKMDSGLKEEVKNAQALLEILPHVRALINKEEAKMRTAAAGGPPKFTGGGGFGVTSKDQTTHGERYKAPEVQETQQQIKAIKDQEIASELKIIELQRMKAELTEQYNEEARRSKDSPRAGRAKQSLEAVKKEIALLSTDKREEDILARQERAYQKEVDAAYAQVSKMEDVEATRAHQINQAWMTRDAAIQKQEEQTAKEIALYDKQLDAEAKTLQQEEAQKQREVENAYKQYTQMQELEENKKQQIQQSWAARDEAIKKQESQTAQEIAQYEKQIEAERKLAESQEKATISATFREQDAAAEARIGEIKKNTLDTTFRLFELEKLLLQLKTQQAQRATGTADHEQGQKRINEVNRYIQALRLLKKETSEKERRQAALTKEEKKATEQKKRTTTASKKQREQFEKMLSPLKQLSSGMNALTASSRMFTRAIKVAMGTITFRTLKEATMQSVEFVEVLNLFNVVMDEVADTGKEFVWQMQEIYGLDPANIMRYTGMFHNLAGAMGMPQESAAQLSMGLTHLGTDMASLFNMPYDKVMENLSSGMQGMTRAVRKYGMDVRMVTLEATAATFGINEKAASMSEVNRQALRYITMMRQGRKALEDYAHTMESPANQLKVLREQMAMFARAVGNFIIMPLERALPYLNGFIMALRMIIESLSIIAGFTPFEYPREDLPGFEYIADELDEATGSANKLKKTIAGFDELNILSDPASGGGGMGGGMGGGLDPRLAAELADMDRVFTDMRMRANEIRDELLEFFGFTWIDTKDGIPKLKWSPDLFRANLIEEFEWAKHSINAMFDTWPEIVASFRNLGSTIYQAFKQSFNPIFDLIKTFKGAASMDEVVADWITNLPARIDRLSDAIERNQWLWDGLMTTFLLLIPVMTGLKILAKVGGWAAALFAPLFAVKKMFGAAAANVGKLVGGFVAFAKKKSIVAAAANPITAVIAGVALAFFAAFTTCEDFRGRVLATVDTIRKRFIPILEKAQESFALLWENAVKPVGMRILGIFNRIWQEGLKPLLGSIVEFVGEVILLGLDIFGALQKLGEYITTNFGPEIDGVLTFLGGLFDIFATIIEEVVLGALRHFTGLLDLLREIIGFIRNVFNRDWDSAMERFGNIAEIAGERVEKSFKAVENVIKSVLGFIGEMLGMREQVEDFVEKLNPFNRTAPPAGTPDSYIDYTNPTKHIVPDIPYYQREGYIGLATGGVVRKPTMAMIGEGHHAEAVVPLENSPQMRDLIEQIALRIGEDRGDDSMVVPVYIAGEKIDEAVVKNINRGNRRTGTSRVVTV